MSNEVIAEKIMENIDLDEFNQSMLRNRPYSTYVDLSNILNVSKSRPAPKTDFEKILELFVKKIKNYGTVTVVNNKNIDVKFRIDPFKKKMAVTIHCR